MDSSHYRLLAEIMMREVLHQHNAGHTLPHTLDIRTRWEVRLQGKLSDIELREACIDLAHAMEVFELLGYGIDQKAKAAKEAGYELKAA